MSMGMSPWGPTPFQTQPVAQVAQVQPNAFMAQPTGFQTGIGLQQQAQTPFSMLQQTPQQLNPSFTGAGFGGFTAQAQPQAAFQPTTLAPIPQDSMATFQTQTTVPTTTAPTFQTGLQAPQSTNPFRQSMLMAQQTGSPFTSTPASVNQQRPTTSPSTNPFARTSPQTSTQPFTTPVSSSPFQQTTTTTAAPMQQPLPTGSTNPFAKNFTGSQATQQAQQQQHVQQRPVTAGGILSQPTGSTNPFRQGAFVNHTTGLGWQHSQQPIGGGLDQLETIPVFPRPAAQTPWQQ